MRETGQGAYDRVALHGACRNIFGALDDALMTELLDAFVIVDLAGGSPLFRQGDSGDSLYILLQGRLNVSVRDVETDTEKLVGETVPGESVGEIGLLTGEPRSASLWATRNCRLARIDQAPFDVLAQNHPDLLRGLAKVVVNLLQKRTSSNRYSSRISCIAILPVRAKNESTRFAKELSGTLEHAGSTMHVDSGSVDDLVGVPGISTSSPQSTEGERLGEWLSTTEEENRFLVLEADAEATEWTRRCIGQADIVLVVGNSADDPAVAATELELIHEDVALRSVRHVLVLLHPEPTRPIEGTSRWLEARRVEEHHHVRIGVPADIERLGRIIAGTAIGLVLGGGGARGFAHAGVYRALCEREIPIDWVKEEFGDDQSLGFLVFTAGELRNQIEFGALAAVVLAFAWAIDLTFTPALCSGLRIVTLWDALTYDLGENPEESIPIFAGLSSAQGRITALMTRVVKHTEGTRLFSAGEPGDSLYVVIDGELQISLPTSDGRAMEFSRARRGDVIGEVGLYHGKRTADVEALSDVRLLSLDAENLARLRKRYPRIGAQVLWNLSQVMAGRLADATDREHALTTRIQDGSLA
jgi:CRP-like cAMP-binding protein